MTPHLMKIPHSTRTLRLKMISVFRRNCSFRQMTEHLLCSKTTLNSPYSMKTLNHPYSTRILGLKKTLCLKKIFYLMTTRLHLKKTFDSKMISPLMKSCSRRIPPVLQYSTWNRHNRKPQNLLEQKFVYLHFHRNIYRERTCSKQYQSRYRFDQHVPQQKEMNLSCRHHKRQGTL